MIAHLLLATCDTAIETRKERDYAVRHRREVHGFSNTSLSLLNNIEGEVGNLALDVSMCTMSAMCIFKKKV